MLQHYKSVYIHTRTHIHTHTHIPTYIHGYFSTKHAVGNWANNPERSLFMQRWHGMARQGKARCGIFLSPPKSEYGRDPSILLPVTYLHLPTVVKLPAFSQSGQKSSCFIITPVMHVCSDGDTIHKVEAFIVDQVHLIAHCSHVMSTRRRSLCQKEETKNHGGDL